MEFELAGTTYHLLLNAAALFDCYERFGDKGSLLDHITGTTTKAFDNTCWMLVKLAQQGEIFRRFQGLDKQPMLTVPQAQALLSPLDLIAAQTAIREAYAASFERKVRDEEEDVDLGLLELQKKTGLASIVRNGFSGRLKSWVSAFQTE